MIRLSRRRPFDQSKRQAIGINGYNHVDNIKNTRNPAVSFLDPLFPMLQSQDVLYDRPTVCCKVRYRLL